MIFTDTIASERESERVDNPNERSVDATFFCLKFLETFSTGIIRGSNGYRKVINYFGLSVELTKRKVRAKRREL